MRFGKLKTSPLAICVDSIPDRFAATRVPGPKLAPGLPWD